MLLLKNKTEMLSNFRENNLRIIFQILFDVKEQQMFLLPNTEHKKTEKLFEIMGNVALLHNQICHLSKEQASTKQIYDHVLRLQRMNFEKSVSDYLNEKEKEKEKLKKEETSSLSTIILGSSQNSFTEFSPSIEKKDIIITKSSKHIESEKKKYLKVNRSLHSNRQKQIPSPMKMNPKIVKNNDIGITMTNSNNINVIDNKQSAPLLPNSIPQKKKSKLLFEETKPPLKKAFSKTGSNFRCVNTDKETHKWMPLALYSEVKTPKKRKNKNLLLIEKSFDKKQSCHTNRDREIGKPSTYAKYLLSKYKDVIDNYGEEMRISLNTSARLHRSSSRKEESKERQSIEITPYHNNLKSNSQFFS